MFGIIVLWILSERSDKELHPYLYQLLDWILDMNWPGAFCIWERLKNTEIWNGLIMF